MESVLSIGLHHSNRLRLRAAGARVRRLNLNGDPLHINVIPSAVRSRAWRGEQAEGSGFVRDREAALCRREPGPSTIFARLREPKIARDDRIDRLAAGST